MDSDLEQAYNVITDAVQAEDVFGNLTEKDTDGKRLHPQKVLENRFNKLSATVNPKLYGSSFDDKDTAEELTLKLNQFYKIAKARLEEGIYGERNRRPRGKQPGQIAFTTNDREYYMGAAIAEGTIATIYEGEIAAGDSLFSQVVMKIANDPNDNDLLRREIRAVRMMREAGGGQRKHLPYIVDQFMTEDDRLGLIIRRLEETYDLYSVREHKNYKNGVPPKHMAWMFNRILSVVGYAHSLGIVHGNIEPSHLMIRPRDHNVILIDWCWSVIRPTQTGDRFLINTKNFSAPEVQDNSGPARPASDIYSVGKCMIFALGGDVESDEMPDAVDQEIQRLLKSCVLKSPLQRANNAWRLYDYFGNVINDLWGKKGFIPFPM